MGGGGVTLVTYIQELEHVRGWAFLNPIEARGLHHDLLIHLSAKVCMGSLPCGRAL